MLVFPALRSFFSFARAERMSFARFRASIRWSSDLSGAAADVLTGGAMRRRLYACPGHAQGGPGKNRGIQLDLDLRLRAASGRPLPRTPEGDPSPWRSNPPPSSR